MSYASPLTGSCQNGRRLLRFSRRLRATTWPSRCLETVPASENRISHRPFRHPAAAGVSVPAWLGSVYLFLALVMSPGARRV